MTRARLLLDGYLGDAPEMRYTPSGKAVIDFSLGVGGGKDFPGRWYKVTFWEADAEMVNELGLRKGVAVRVEGNLVEAEGWIGKDGKGKGKVKVAWVDTLEYQSGDKMVLAELPSRDTDGKRPVEAVAETSAEDNLKIASDVAIKVLGEDVSMEAVTELIAGKGKAKDVKRFKELMVELAEAPLPEDIPF